MHPAPQLQPRPWSYLAVPMNPFPLESQQTQVPARPSMHLLHATPAAASSIIAKVAPVVPLQSKTVVPLIQSQLGRACLAGLNPGKDSAGTATTVAMAPPPQSVPSGPAQASSTSALDAKQLANNGKSKTRTESDKETEAGTSACGKSAVKLVTQSTGPPAAMAQQDLMVPGIQLPQPALPGGTAANGVAASSSLGKRSAPERSEAVYSNPEETKHHLRLEMNRRASKKCRIKKRAEYEAMKAYEAALAAENGQLRLHNRTLEILLSNYIKAGMMSHASIMQRAAAPALPPLMRWQLGATSAFPSTFQAAGSNGMFSRQQFQLPTAVATPKMFAPPLQLRP